MLCQQAVDAVLARRFEIGLKRLAISRFIGCFERLFEQILPEPAQLLF